MASLERSKTDDTDVARMVRDRSYHNLGSQFATWPGLL